MSKETVVVTCQGTTKAGNPCKATRGLIDGYCASHRTNKHKELLEQVKKSKRSGAARKSAKKKPLPGATDELANLIDAMDNPEVADGTTKPAFVGGKWVEVPVDVAADVAKKADELYDYDINRLHEDPTQPEEVALEALTVVEVRYSIVEALAILDQYKALLKYVQLDKVKDKIALAEVLVDVVKMSQEEVVKESLATTELINKFSLKVKYMREDAKTAYGENVPESIVKEIEELDTLIFKLKCGKGILTAAEEIYEQGSSDDKEEDKKPSLFARFIGWVDKNWKPITATCLTLAGLVMILVALMSANDVQPPVKHSVPPVVTEEPVGEHVPANFAELSNAKPIVGQSVVVKKSVIPGSKPIAPDFTGLSNAADDARITADDAPVSTMDVVVHDGDTLWDIAVKVYGDGTQWVKIWDANQDTIAARDARNLDDPGHWIHPGQVLHVNISDSLNDH